MGRRRSWLVTVFIIAILAIVSLVLGNQIKALRERQRPAAMANQRQLLFDLLTPVALSNCQFERFGEAHDGGYLMCGNLLDAAESAYSYGIGGYDQWGCDVSTRLSIPLHQYDCFNTTQPSCQTATTLFHAECVGSTTKTQEGRRFDTIANQLARNADRGKRIVLKIDVEGAEWDALLTAPDDVLQQIDQLAIEFHEVQHEKYLRVVRRLLRLFHVAHIHFNNHSCKPGLEPFPAWAYEVLFVSKRIAKVDPSTRPAVPHPLDAPNTLVVADCQSAVAPAK